MRNGMRVTIVTLALAMLGGSAAWAAGPGTGPGMGPANCPAASPEQAQKLDAFRQQTQPLRETMAQLRTELRTLRAQSNPDWAAISAKQKEMVDVRVELQKQAAEAGLPFGGGRGHGRGCGSGRGMGFGGMGWN